MLKLLTVPFEVAAKAASTAARVAAKAQQVATRVALASARLAARMTERAGQLTQKVAGIQAKAAAKADARAIAKVLKSLPRKPTTHFVREARHGQTSVAYYRRIDHRAGKVSEFWTLNRDTPRGRVRLASGWGSGPQSVRALANRPARPTARTQRPQQTQGPTQQPRQPVERQRATGPRQGQPTKAHSAKPERAQKPEQNRKPRSHAADDKPSTYHLVYIEGMNKDGTARARVVMSTKSLDMAMAVQKLNPRVAIHARAGPSLRRGDVINIDPRKHGAVARCLHQRQERQKNLATAAQAVAGAAALNGPVAKLAEKELHRQTLTP